MRFCAGLSLTMFHPRFGGGGYGDGRAGVVQIPVIGLPPLDLTEMLGEVPRAVAPGLSSAIAVFS